MKNEARMRDLQSGEKVTITDKKHPWFNHRGTLLHYGQYGLTFMCLFGWRIKLDNGTECYANTSQINP